MRFSGSIGLDEPRDVVWKLFEDPAVVAHCIPGLDGFRLLDDDNFAATVSQTVGPVTAVFAMKLSVLERLPGESISFSAVGKTTRGAVSHLRTSGLLRLEDDGEGTLLTLSADASLGGVLGTVAEKVLQKQSEKVTVLFGQALRQELSGERAFAAPTAAPTASAAVSAEEEGVQPLVGRTETVGPPPSELLASGVTVKGLDSRLAALCAGLAAGLVLGLLARRLLGGGRAP